MINGVSRALFEAEATRAIAVKLPEEALSETEQEQDLVRILLNSLYGTRDAAAIFQKEVRRFMSPHGFRIGRYNVSIYYNKGKGLVAMVHGDDFVTVGGSEENQWLKVRLEERFETKIKMIGAEDRGSKEESVLNIIVGVDRRRLGI